MHVNRRNFIKGTTAAMVLSSFGAYGIDLMHRETPIRVGLIGTGWYGKSDLFRLIQVANVEVISLCDTDARMLEEAAELTSQRQRSGKKPRTYSDYRKMLSEKDNVEIQSNSHSMKKKSGTSMKKSHQAQQNESDGIKNNIEEDVRNLFSRGFLGQQKQTHVLQK